MVLEDSDVEMIVAEIEVSVSRWLLCVEGQPNWICWIMAPALYFFAFEKYLKVGKNNFDTECGNIICCVYFFSLNL